ncbi:MAG TPA: putative baseplate assembly protein [Telluria sp.]|nr:putative baseplate assembly protein [Telluria sp.]
MSATCSCCGGAGTCTAARMLNRPSLARIAYRAGTYATFLDRMMARLSSNALPQLAALTRRDSGDPSVALLDAWAVAADVLSFYNERIANEAYLRTATERRSVLELARLTGYRLRPGVAASVYLAYELEKEALPLTLPIGTRSQSIPGPGETMQTFETAETLEARAAWNLLQLRQSQPQVRTPDTLLTAGVWLQGVATQLKPNDALLIVFENAGAPKPYRVARVTADAAADRTRLNVREWNGKAMPQDAGTPLKTALFSNFIEKLITPPKLQPGNALRLARNLDVAYAAGADVFPQLLQSFTPILGDTLYTALGNAPLTVPVPLKVIALRASASLFGHNAPNQPKPVVIGREGRGAALAAADLEEPTLELTWGDLIDAENSTVSRVALDRVYDQVKPATDSYVLIDRPTVRGPNKDIAGHLGLHRIDAVNTSTMATWVGAALDVTELMLDPEPGTGFDGPWLADLDKSEFGFAVENSALLRGTRVYAQSEELPLADEPIVGELCDEGTAHEIELGALYDGLKPGRWLTIAGERSDVGNVANIPGAELVMLAAVRHGLQQLPGGGDLPGDSIHTFITLARPLAYCYKRATVAFNANVVRATHGETRREVAGGGDPTKAFQKFDLKQSPLTYVAARTPDGVASTLSMWVNDVRWPEVRSLLQLGPDARGYVSRRDNEERTSVVFGDGSHGARLPGGADNIRATYRSGIGKGGNVAAGQISLATDKPLGVKGLRNPLRASGGAGPDSIDQARQNAPLAVMALDRLVSVQDYADFSRLFAGIGKAAAALQPGARGQFVQVTIAGVDDIPIDASSDLFQNLVDALHRFGDPQLALQVGVRQALALVINAKVALLPDYAWETVAPKLRAVLGDAFGFARRELGEDVVTSAIVGTIQQVEGVDYALVRATVYTRDELVSGLTGAARAVPEAAGPAMPCGEVRIAVGATQIAYLAPDVPDSLILELL